jgi:hypothetical protein
MSIELFVFFDAVLERAEGDCEQLFPHAEIAKRYDDAGNVAGNGGDDDFLDVSESDACRSTSPVLIVLKNARSGFIAILLSTDT